MQDAVLLTDLSTDELQSAYSDCFKSEFGGRPRWGYDDRDAMIAYLESYAERIDDLRAQWDEEERWFAEREVREEQERLEAEAERLAARQTHLEAEEDALLDSLVASASRRRSYVLPTHHR
jgi:hypothetical protein